MGMLRRLGGKGGDVGRLRWVLYGLLLGLAWGTVMWAVTGASGGVRVWLYLSLTMAMIGGGVAAIFGAMSARRRGERISPRIIPGDADETRARARATRAEARAQAKADADARKQSR